MRSETKTYTDPISGVPVTQWTDYKGHSHHFYFTNPGWYEDGRKLLFSSDRGNRTNLYGVNLAGGEIEQLTDLEPVPLPREMEFLRACRNPRREEVYFWHDLRLMALDIASRRTRVLHESEPGWCASMTNASADGRHVFFGSCEDLSDRIHTYQDGRHVGYHGHTSTGRPMLGRVRFDGADRREHEFPGQTGHIFSHDEKLVVGDGGGVIRVWKRDGDTYAPPRVLCRHGSTMHIQQSHPHPRISPDGQYVVFTSDRTGYCNVYTVPLVPFESLPRADG